MWIFLLIIMGLPLVAQADDFEYTESPETTQAFRDMWGSINATLQRSSAIRAQHARERERARREDVPIPPEWMVNPRYMHAPPSPPPYIPSPPMPSMLRTPDGSLYHFYGNMMQGPHGELYTTY